MTILDNGYIVDGMNTFECEIKRLIDMFVASFCIVLVQLFLSRNESVVSVDLSLFISLEA